LLLYESNHQIASNFNACPFVLENSRKARAMLDAILSIAFLIALIIQGCFTLIPLGNENSTVRRLPWVTFSIMALNVMIYYTTLPTVVEQDREWLRARTQLQKFLADHRELLIDGEVRRELADVGVITRAEAETIERELELNGEADDYKYWLRGAEATRLREELDKRLIEDKAAMQARLSCRFGIGPNGNWRIHQLVTYAFLHGSTLHLFGNLIFFFAVAFSLEDLWGRSLFLSFYLMAAATASLPYVLAPSSVPLIGASGAIFATMGAFLIRLHNAKIKLGWVTLAFAIPFLVFGKKPFGTLSVPAYLFLPYFFVNEVLFWWYINKVGPVSMVAHSVHIVGFIFGVAFALVIKALKVEENYICPKIEAKVSFSADPAVTRALEALDRGELESAERMLKAHLARHPNDLDTMLSLIQVYQRKLDYDQLNAIYGRVIRYHLANNDKEAALYSYDSLLSSFPDDQVNVKIQPRDWLTLCEYLREMKMYREAAVEYDRFVTTYPNDSLAMRACVQGGEAALAAHDDLRALRLFQKAQTMNPPPPLAARIEAGIEKCKLRLDNRPTWLKQPQRPEAFSKDFDKHNLPW
jgi:membrane associated rhomboid family serine protease